MFYYVMKTGLSAFDSCRAYGLALILHRLSICHANPVDVQIEDVGPWFQLTGPELSRLPPDVSRGVFDDLLTVSDAWCGVLLTTGRTPTEGRLSRTGRRNVLDKIDLVRQALQEYPARLSSYQLPAPCEMRVSVAQDYCSVPASLDASAVKGVRRQKLNFSTVGDQLYVRQKDWALALLGGVVSMRWVWCTGDYVALLPEPLRIGIRDHLAACAMENTGYLLGAAPRVAAAHYAIRLLQALRRTGAGDEHADSRYGTMIFQSMAFAGNQWKAKSSGSFPLEALHVIQAGDSNVADRLLSLWDTLLRWTSIDGNSAPGLALADFLGDPSLTRFGHYVRTHSVLAVGDKRTDLLYRASWFSALLPLLSEPHFMEVFGDCYVSRVGRAIQRFAREGGGSATIAELQHVQRLDDLDSMLYRFLNRYEAHVRSRYRRELEALFLQADDTKRVVDRARESSASVRLTATALLAHTLIHRFVAGGTKNDGLETPNDL